MDSRPHDDFIQPERSIVDEASPSLETTSTGRQALFPAPAEATGTDDLHDAIDDLEFELADLLAPDLEAMDLDEPSTDTPAPEISETLAEDAGGEAVAALGATVPDASGQPAAEPIVASEPAATDAPSASDTLAVDDGTLLDADELEPTLDDMAAEFLAAEPEATVEDHPVSEEPAAAPAKTDVVPQVVTVAEPTDNGLPAGDERAAAGSETTPVIEATAETSGQAPVAETAELPAAEPATPVEQERAEAIAVPPPESTAGTDDPDSGAPVTFEQALDAQDFSAAGFEAAVRGAADRSRSRFLFQMPVHTVADCQRVAAVNLPGDESPKTVLVLLAADGRSYRMEDARDSDNPFAGMAVSYGGLLAHLKSLPTRAAA